MIRSVYYAGRHRTFYRWFRAPIDIHFVKFSGATTNGDAESYHVSIFDKPKAFPPKDQVAEGRYDLPDPLEPDVPIDADTFLHYLTIHPGHIDSKQCVWLPRFAKRCRESAKPETGSLRPSLQPEWGVRVIEGPNHWLFVVIIMVVAVVCVLLGTIIGWALGDTFKGLGGAGIVFGICFAALNFIYGMMKDMGERVKAKTS